MPAATVWFNKCLSNTWEVLALLREQRRPDEFRLLCTHPRGSYPGHAQADLFEKEPIGLADEDYVAYALDVVVRHKVELFVPGRKLLPIVQAHKRFTALGAKLLAAAEADTLRLLHDKARLYAALADSEVGLPDHEVVTRPGDFAPAWKRLRGRHPVVCYKPAVSVYGLGFHIITDAGTPQRLLRHDPRFQLGIEEAAHDVERRVHGGSVLLMEYLPGPERSVDCLARDGELLCCVVRRKEDAWQVLEDNPKLVAAVRTLTRRFRLSNLFNVQFRDSGGRSYLLEINPRMSGGLPFACRSGVVLPYWAIRLALGTASPEDIPRPATGIRVPQPEPVRSL